MATLKWKRVYDQANPSDGDRILVDQLWPRGVSREKAALDGWAKGITPCKGIRLAYHQGRLNFDQFSRSYEEELQTSQAFPDFVDDLNQRLDQRDVTLVFAGRVPGQTHLPVLRDQLEKAGIESDPLPTE